MQPLNAIVKNGRLTLDEATDQPEGHVVVLLPLEELLSMAEKGETFEIVSAPARQWRKPRGIDARALIDELHAM